MKNIFYHQTLPALIVCMVLSLSGCTKRNYLKALNDASQPTEAERYCHLTKISADNPNLVWKEIGNERYILVSTWKADAKYYKNDPKTGFYNTGKYPIWVTAAPELQQLIAGEKRQPKRLKSLEKRLKQLLGIPPNADKKVFVEFWVRPQDLVRPCVNTSVTDDCCELYSSTVASPDCDNLGWMLDQTRASFADSILYNRYPFTGLGYTYDWKRRNKKHVGITEFVIGKDKNIVVEAVVGTMDYFNKKYN